VDTELLAGDPDEMLKAVASLTEVPAGDISEWVVVAVRKDDTFRVGFSLCCTAHVLMVLAATAADLVTGVAAEGHKPAT
jgi:hypothetical protein